MFRGYIYIVKNYINDKVYIGQTTTTIEKRWLKHKCSRNCQKTKHIHFYRALCKYGVEQFYVEEITHVDCTTKKKLIEELNRLERLYILQFNSFKNGYNSTAGGEGMLHFTMSEKTRQKLSRINKGKKLSEETRRKMCLSRKGRKMTEESKRRLSKSKIGIIPSQEHIRKSALKHIGLKMSNETKQKIYNSLKREILQYTTDGILVKEWDCIRDAANAFGLKSTSQIRNVLNGKLHTTQGFVWKYKYGTVGVKKSKRAVVQIDLENTYINEYESAADAGRMLGISSDGIIACCKNKRITSGGYKWKYKEEYGN